MAKSTLSTSEGLTAYFQIYYHDLSLAVLERASSTTYPAVLLRSQAPAVYCLPLAPGFPLQAVWVEKVGKTMRVWTSYWVSTLPAIADLVAGEYPGSNRTEGDFSQFI